MGRDFDVSVAYVSKKQMHALNKAHRKIDKPTDILSFPYSKKSGELILCLPEVRTHAALHQKTADEYLPFLFIHGMLHLKGYDHGRIMDRLEKKFWNILHGTTHRSGDRRRDLPGPRRRIKTRRRG